MSDPARRFHASKPANDGDPREARGAEVIDLATRHVLPAVARRPGKGEPLAVAGGLLAVALLGGVTFWNMSARRVEKAAVAPAPVAGAPVALPPGAVPVQPAMPAPMPAFRPMTPVQPGMAVQPAAGARTAAPAVVFDAGALPEPVAQAPGLAGAPTASTGNGNDDFASRLGAGGGGKAQAGAAFDPKTTVAQGTLIPAVLETAIQTDVPGYVRAVVSADVRSFDGTRVLVPRSSRLVGQYKSGMQGGQKRVYVIWTRLIRPDGVAVALASPATGIGGEAGVGGQVSTHFFERFGSAMVLTVMSGLSAIGGGAASVVIGGAGQSAAAAAVGQSGQIGPTVRVHPGEPVRVFTARDLDFARVSRE